MSAWKGKASILAQAELKALFGKGKVFEGPEMKKGKTMSSPPRSFYYVYYFYFSAFLLFLLYLLFFFAAYKCTACANFLFSI